MKTAILLFNLVLLTSVCAVAQCSPSFTYHQNFMATGDPYSIAFVNTTAYTGAGTPTYTITFAGSPAAYALTDSTSISYVSGAATLHMSVYDSASATVLCADSVTHTINFVYPACMGGIFVNIDSTHFRLDSTYCRFSVFTSWSPSSSYTYTWSFTDGSTATGAAPSIIYTGTADTAGTYGSFDGTISVPYTVTVSGGGCDYTLLSYALLPHKTFSCANYSSSLALAAETVTGTAPMTLLSNSAEIFNGLYKASVAVDFGDGTTGDYTAADSANVTFAHSYAYTGDYNIRYTTTLTNMLDADHQTCIIKDYVSADHQSGITDSFKIATPGSSALPVSITPAAVNICAGETLSLGAADTLHTTAAYFTSFYRHPAAGYAYATSADVAAAYTSPVAVTAGWQLPATMMSAHTGTDSTVVVAGITTADSGLYIFNITNGTGAAHSYPVHVTVTPASLPAITGAATICTGSTTALGNAVAGGVWSATGAASIDAAGTITGLSEGTANITYTLTNSCGTHTATTAVTVTAAPVLAPIAGAADMCLGAITVLTDATAGGTWISSNPSVATVSSGLVHAVGAGTVTISYSTTGSCGNTNVHTTFNVNTTPVADIVVGLSGACAGNTATLEALQPGGVWNSSAPAIAAISAAGVITTGAVGAATISYTMTNACGTATQTTTFTTHAIPVVTATAAHAFCGSATDTVTATGALIYNWATATGISCTSCDVVTITAPGTYSVTGTTEYGCSNSSTVTVGAGTMPAITATVTGGCGATIVAATGGTAYQWAPADGLDCSNCAATIATGTAYTVTGTNADGCTATTAVTINTNKIKGNVSFSEAAPTSTEVKVWLIKYNTMDSSLITLDSTVTCSASGIPYYEFDAVAPGNYMVKAALVYGAAPGAAGYIPTYSYSTPYWYEAATVNHTTGTDELPVTMIYGTLPAGDGSISGTIATVATPSGASMSATGNNVMVYLRNTATNILTYVYADASGNYTFSGLASGSYDIYPATYDYYTTPSETVTIGAGSETVSNRNFTKCASMRTITPVAAVTATAIHDATVKVNVYPNPTRGELSISWSAQQEGPAQLTITDAAGRTVQTTYWNINTATGTHQADVAALTNGIYFISIQSAGINYSGKIIKE